MSIAYRYHNNRDDAMAVLNICFYKVLMGLQDFLKKNKAESFNPWMTRIMINTIIDEYRKNKKRKDCIEAEPDEKNERILLKNSDYNKIEEIIEAEELQNMLNRLPELHQKVFNLFVIDGYRHKEIAEMLDISVANSKWCLSTARKELKRLLKELAKLSSKKSA